MLVLRDDLLLNYTRCSRRAYLNLKGDATQAEPPKAFVQKLRRENQRQIRSLCDRDPTQSAQYPRGDWQAGYEATLTLMAQGVERIEHAVLWLPFSRISERLRTWANFSDVAEIPPFAGLGRPTLLVRQPGQSCFGNWRYDVLNVKLGKRPKSEYKLIAAFQAFLLSQIQECWPEAQLQLRTERRYTVDVVAWQERLWATILDLLNTLQQPTAPEVFISRQRCGLCQWQTSCVTVAREIQHLSLVPGVTPARYAALQELAVTELEQLATVPFPTEDAPLALPIEVSTRLQQQARSLLYAQAIPIPNSGIPLPIPESPIELYFDLEAEPERQVDFLFGVLCVNHQQETEQFYALTAKQPEEEPLIWQQFLALVDRYPHALIYHFSGYEVETLRRLSRHYGLAHRSIQSLLDRCVDIHELIVKSVTLPVESYSLKTIAKWLDFQWRDQGLSGDQTVCLYDEWLETGDRACLDTIIRYNEDDCRATHHLKTWLAEFWQQNWR